MMTVKALIWSHRNDQPAYEVCADCPFGRYAISPAGEHGYGWKQPRQNVWAGFVPTCEEAKAAAQADYEARILSALEPTEITLDELAAAERIESVSFSPSQNETGKLTVHHPSSALTNTSGDDEAPVAWAYRNNADDRFLLTHEEPEICFEKRPLFARPESAAVRDEATSLPQDVINLVIAAREFWDANNDLSPESLALDVALDGFARRVPFDNEPDALHSTQEG